MSAMRGFDSAQRAYDNASPPEAPAWQEAAQGWVDDCPFTLSPKQKDELLEWAEADHDHNVAEASKPDDCY